MLRTKSLSKLLKVASVLLCSSNFTRPYLQKCLDWLATWSDKPPTPAEAAEGLTTELGLYNSSGSSLFDKPNRLYHLEKKAPSTLELVVAMASDPQGVNTAENLADLALRRWRHIRRLPLVTNTKFCWNVLDSKRNVDEEEAFEDDDLFYEIEESLDEAGQTRLSAAWLRSQSTRTSSVVERLRIMSQVFDEILQMPNFRVIVGLGRPRKLPEGSENPYAPLLQLVENGYHLGEAFRNKTKVIQLIAPPVSLKLPKSNHSMIIETVKKTDAAILKLIRANKPEYKSIAEYSTRLPGGSGAPLKPYVSTSLKVEEENIGVPGKSLTFIRIGDPVNNRLIIVSSHYVAGAGISWTVTYSALSNIKLLRQKKKLATKAYTLETSAGVLRTVTRLLKELS